MDINKINEESYKLNRDIRSKSQALNQFITRYKELKTKLDLVNESYSVQTSLARTLSKFTYNDIKSADKINELKSRSSDLEKIISEKREKVEKAEELRSKLVQKDKQKEIAILDKYIKQQNYLISHTEELSSLARDAVSEFEKFYETLDDIGKVSKAISKIPIFDQISPRVHRITEAIQKSIVESGENISKWTAGFKAAGKQLSLMAIEWIVKYSIKANEEQIALGRNLALSAVEANILREQYVEIANASGDNFITTSKLIDATQKIGQHLGFNKAFSAELSEQFVVLTEKIGLSDNAASGLVKTSIVYGQKLQNIKEDILGSVSALSSQYGINIDMNTVLEETGKSSALVLANFNNNPVALAKGITKLKLLGTTLDTVRQQSEALLDFPTSIENQLQASILLGRQFNMERAREYALNNNLVGVAEELQKQQVGFNEFSKLNVIQQKGLAAALGLSTQELADQLLLLETQNKSRSQIIALNGKDAANRKEQLTAQLKFNSAVDKLKDIIGNLVSGPLGLLLDTLTDSLNALGSLVAGLEKLMGNTLTKVLLSTLTGAGIGASFGGQYGAAIGGVAGLGLSLLSAFGGMSTDKSNEVPLEDGIVEPGGKITYSGNKDSIKINEKDSIVVGTNLFKEKQSTPVKQDFSEIVNSLNKLGDRLDKISNRPVIAYSKPSEFASPITIYQQQNIRKSI